MATYNARRMGADWWRQRGAYTFVMVRELTSVCIGAYLIGFVVLLAKLAEGPEAYAGYLAFLSSPLMLLFHALAMAGALFHTFTWFNLAPRALVVRVGEEKVPDFLIAAPHYMGWIVVSLIVLLVVLL
jgi:fumarate reductase subunit C